MGKLEVSNINNYIIMDSIPADTKTSLWNFKAWNEYEWFRFLSILLLALVAGYLILHLLCDRVWKTGDNYEYLKLDAVQMQQVNRIYFDPAFRQVQQADTPQHNAPAAPSTTPGVDKSTTNKSADTSKKTGNSSPVRSQVDTGCNCLTASCLKIGSYLSNEFNYAVDTNQLNSLKKYICSATPMEAIGFLNNVRLKVKSNFWLIGPKVYFEIVFWSWFGVLCSLLFSLGVVGRSSTTNPDNPKSVFDSSEIPSQIAKLLYAPLCTLIIVFGYNYFKDQNIVDISSSKGVIVFAFIGGFYSSRLIAFLDRLKEVVLPNSGTAELSDSKKNLQPGIAADLKDVLIELKLDDTSLQGEIRNEVSEIGLGDAEVTLQNEKGEVIKATKSGEDQDAQFVVASLKAGHYIIKATWSKEVMGEIINIYGEQEQDIKSNEVPIIISMQKSESSG